MIWNWKPLIFHKKIEGSDISQINSTILNLKYVLLGG